MVAARETICDPTGQLSQKQTPTGEELRRYYRSGGSGASDDYLDSLDALKDLD
jgi:hypothetical protein